MTIPELESLIESSGKDIYSFCEQLTRSRLEADELYQDTFLQAVQKVNKIDKMNTSGISSGLTPNILLMLKIRILKMPMIKRLITKMRKLKLKLPAGHRKQSKTMQHLLKILQRPSHQTHRVWSLIIIQKAPAAHWLPALFLCTSITSSYFVRCVSLIKMEPYIPVNNEFRFPIYNLWYEQRIYLLPDC